MTDFNKYSLTDIVKLIKTKKISSLEITNHFIKNIEKGKTLNSFITTCFEKCKKKQKILTQKRILMVYYQEFH